MGGLFGPELSFAGLMEWGFDFVDPAKPNEILFYSFSVLRPEEQAKWAAIKDLTPLGSLRRLVLQSVMVSRSGAQCWILNLQQFSPGHPQQLFFQWYFDDNARDDHYTYRLTHSGQLILREPNMTDPDAWYRSGQIFTERYLGDVEASMCLQELLGLRFKSAHSLRVG